MNYFLKQRFSFWLVFFLVVINIAAISTIVYHIISEKSAIQSAEPGIDAGKIINQELSLNTDQRNLFQHVNREYNQKSKKILDQLTEKRSEMLAELAEENPDTSLLHSIAEDIGHLHTDLKLLTIDNFLELKKICTPGQQQQLSKMYNDILDTEGPFKGYGKQYRYRYRHGQGSGKGMQKNN